MSKTKYCQASENNHLKIKHKTSYPLQNNPTYLKSKIYMSNRPSGDPGFLMPVYTSEEKQLNFSTEAQLWVKNHKCKT